MPTLRERWNARFAKRAATYPIAFNPPAAQYFGAGIGTQPDHQTLLRETLGIADTGVRAIANRLGSLNPQVKISRQGQTGTTEDEILDDHRLKILLDRPHPNYSRFQMLRLIGQYIVTVGVAYLLKVGSRLQVPIELHPMPPWLVTPQIDMGVVHAYSVLDGSGKPHTIPAENIVRFYFPDPESPWTSEGYIIQRV